MPTIRRAAFSESIYAAVRSPLSAQLLARGSELLDISPGNAVRPMNSLAWVARNLAKSASSDHFPGPLISRYRTTMICAYSDRISCKTAHAPILGGAGGNGRGDVPR